MAAVTARRNRLESPGSKHASFQAAGARSKLIEPAVAVPHTVFRAGADSVLCVALVSAARIEWPDTFEVVRGVEPSERGPCCLGLPLAALHQSASLSHQRLHGTLRRSALLSCV